MPRETATFAAGCFWGVEAEFRALSGVTGTTVGYTGGSAEHPTYKQVCRGRTGHAEAVQVEYDPSRVSYNDLLAVFWASHNPTTRNRQGWDIGSQYRSAIFFHGDEQNATALASREAHQREMKRAIRHRNRARRALLGRRGVPPAVTRKARAGELRGLPRRRLTR